MPHQTIIRNLTDAHRNMERVLTFMRLQVDSIREADGDDPAELSLLGNAVAYMRNYPGVNHHPTEDLVLGRLVAYAPGEKSLCASLSEQHRGFGRRETSLLRHIRSAQGGDARARQQVKEMGTSYCVDNLSHIRTEEMDLFPRAIKWLSALDWQDIGRRSEALTDADFERNELKRYDNLYDRIMSVGPQLDPSGD